MRSVMLASRPCFEKLFGIPNIPNRNASRIPTISANFQVRFLFMRKLDPLLTSLRGELALRAADGVGAYERCRPYRTRAQPIYFPQQLRAGPANAAPSRLRIGDSVLLLLAKFSSQVLAAHFQNGPVPPLLGLDFILRRSDLQHRGFGHFHA